MIRTFNTTNNEKISIGKNAKGNDYLCRNSSCDAYWFHVHNHPSCHGILHCSNPSKQSLYEVATLVKQYSKLKYNKKVKVTYCKLSNVHCTKTLGLVSLHKSPEILIV